MVDVIDVSNELGSFGSPDESRSGLSYDAFLTLRPNAEAHDRVVEQITTWFREKNIEADPSKSSSIATADWGLDVVHHSGSQIRDMMLRLVESNHTGKWRTQLVLHAPDVGAGWIRLKVTNDGGRFVDVPRVATYIMDVLETFDGLAMFTSEPRLFQMGQCEDLIDILCDPDRVAPVFVAGSNSELPFDAYFKRVHKWTKQVRGMGHVIVLNPLATDRFSDLVGPAHSAGAGTIRTYLREVDFASNIDARRHKILGTRRLVEQSDFETRKLLGRIVRGLAGDRSLPNSVSRVERTLRRIEDSSLLAGISSSAIDESLEVHAEDQRTGIAEAVLRVESAATIADRAEIYLGQIELAKVILGVGSLDETELRNLAAAAERGRVTAKAIDRVTRQLREHEVREMELEDEAKYLRELADDLELHLAITEAEQANLVDENRWLRDRLRAARDFEGATVTVPESAITRYPRTFDELLSRVDEFASAGVIYSGDRKLTLDLDALDRLERLVRAAWDALLTVSDFLRARRGGDCSGGLVGYIEQTPAGYRGMSNKKFSAGETGATMKQFGDERIFPVPREVSPDGLAAMKTHFKLGQVGMASPRMYVLDRSSLDDKVYVGYIGTHKTNTKTN